MGSDCSHEIKRQYLIERKTMTNIECIKKQRDHFTDKCPSSQNYVVVFFPVVMYIWMWELEHKEGWEPKNWCFGTGAGEDPWESLGQQGDQSSQS